ncbi:MAG: hypothetical protein K2M48_00155, partial [Clostridiales bacterium]|nr:hypothetical protein [Clostridiales bacterium]
SEFASCLVCSVLCIRDSLNAEEYDLFVRLMGLSPDSTSEGKVNLRTITNDCVNKINDLLDYGDIVLGISDKTENGIGTITANSSISIPTM